MSYPSGSKLEGGFAPFRNLPLNGWRGHRRARRGPSIPGRYGSASYSSSSPPGGITVELSEWH